MAEEVEEIKEVDIIHNLDSAELVIVTIKNNDGHWGEKSKIPDSLIGSTFLCKKTGSHSVQPVEPFGQWWYNIYTINVSEVVRLRDRGFRELESSMNPVLRNGNESWYKGGKLHRDGKPAKISKYGAKIWYQNGVIERPDNLPAMVTDNTKTWYINGKERTPEQMEVIKLNTPEFFI